jgi:1,4-dihydroxy-6-naphthoate synthase
VSGARALALGFTPCPNDTFAFWGVATGRVPVPGARIVPEIEDIEALNARAFDPARRLPVTKLSIPAFARLRDVYALLPSGAVLGHGVGPLVVRSAARFDVQSLHDLEDLRVAIPGQWTTARLLLESFGPAGMTLVPMRFDWIMPSVANGDVDAGVVIHEGRFTFPQHGLVEVADLGALWELATHLPLPLAVMAAERSLGAELHDALGRALRASVELARKDPAAPRAYVRQHARELDDKVCERHVALYVNDLTVAHGEVGRKAIEAMLARIGAAG